MANVIPGGGTYKPPFNPLITQAASTIQNPAAPSLAAPAAAPAAYQPPDYQSLISSMLAPLQQQSAAMTAADKASLRAQQQRAIIQFGASLDGTDPSLVGPGFAKAIDQHTLELARKNTESGLSVQARLGQAHTDAVSQIRNSLAARGLLRSGATGYQLGREQTNYTRSQYDARQQVLDYLSGIQSAFAQAEQQRQWALAMAAMQSAQQIPFYPPTYTGSQDQAPAQQPAAVFPGDVGPGTVGNVSRPGQQVF
jgi:hypothetical protein